MKPLRRKENECRIKFIFIFFSGSIDNFFKVCYCGKKDNIPANGTVLFGSIHSAHLVTEDVHQID